MLMTFFLTGKHVGIVVNQAKLVDMWIFMSELITKWFLCWFSSVDAFDNFASITSLTILC